MKIISVLLIVSFCSCNRSMQNPDFKKKEQISYYLKTEQGIANDKTSVIFFVNGSSSACTPCLELLPKFFQSFVLSNNSSKFEKYLITTEDRKNITENINLSEINLLLDTDYNLQKHGIDFPYNFMIEFSSLGELVYWNLLTENTFDEILNRYNH